MKSDKPPPRSAQRLVAAAVTSGPFLEANSRRRGFLVSSLATTSITISSDNPAVLANGITVPMGFPPVHFCLYIHGDWVQKQLQCIGALAETFGVVEILE